jgi:preprotein translocase subunit SecE
VSDDRTRETEEEQERAEASSDAGRPASAASVRRERQSDRPFATQRSGVTGKDRPTSPRGATETKVSPPVRLIRFLREVVSELRKVIWPSRRELVVYTMVVLVFVSFMVAFVALLDMGLGRAVLSVFG